MQKTILLAAWTLALAGAAEAKKPAKAPASALDRYIAEATGRGGALSGPDVAGPSAGSLFAPGGRLGDLARDARASQVDDIVTIVVSDRASALAKGTTNTARQSSAKYSVGALLGLPSAAGALTNLAGLSGDAQLQGQGTTSRETVLSTTVSARVTHVLPNGYLVLEGQKENVVNSERQTVIVRGVVRPTDLGPANSIASNRLAQLEIRINGKGVVGDAVRRPFFLYRLLLGLLPF
jgi:flagellar L-ring protein precursor FlgH